MITRSKANTLLKQLVGVSTTSGTTTTWTPYYLGLGTNATTPLGDGSNFTEPAIPDGQVDGNGDPITVNEYQRVALDMMGDPANAIIKNSSIVFFNEAENYSWGTIKYFGIFTAKTGGTPIFWAELSTPVQIPRNYIPIFRANKLQIGLDQDPASPVTP